MDQASQDTFVIYSTGTAMSGRFPEGTMLIVDPNAKLSDGDYIIARIAKLPEAIFRQLIYGESGKFLYAHDPRYQTHKLSSADKIIGKVIQARTNF
jgi:SOS-response transcriptional repressor LexA